MVRVFRSSRNLGRHRLETLECLRRRGEKAEFRGEHEKGEAPHPVYAAQGIQGLLPPAVRTERQPPAGGGFDKIDVSRPARPIDARRRKCGRPMNGDG